MTIDHRRHNLSRLAIAGAFLLTGLAGTAQAATAGPLSDAGGSGHGSTIAENTELDGPSLVGSGPEREIVANADDQQVAGTLDETARSTDLIALTPLDGPSLVGSGPEREIVANADDQQVAATLDETARSTDLAALSPDPSTSIAVAPAQGHLGQPY